MLERQRKLNSQAGFHHAWTCDITHRAPLYWNLRCVISNSFKPLLEGDRGACWVQENMLSPIMSSWQRKRCLISLQEKKQSKWEKAEPPVLNNPQSDSRITGGERKIRPVVGQNYTKWPSWEGFCNPRLVVLVPGWPQRMVPSALRKPHQHAAAEMIPRGSTSCGPPDKTHAEASQLEITKRRSVHTAIVIALQPHSNILPAGFCLHCDRRSKRPPEESGDFVVMEVLQSSRRVFQTGSGWTW